MKIITFFNNKGGVGKTTLAVNIAAFLAERRQKKILFLDADPQANSTQMIIPEEQWSEFYSEGANRATLMTMLSPIYEGDSDVNLNVDIVSKDSNRFLISLIPGHPKVSVVEDVLSQSWNEGGAGQLGGFRRTNWLRNLSSHYSKDYDLLIIDVGPSLGALNRSVLLNSDFIVTPMGSDIFSLIGVSNISIWITDWMRGYCNAIINLNQRNAPESIEKYNLNLDVDKQTRLVGYSIQQYVTKSFKEGRRPVISYDRIIREIPEAIQKHLEFLIYDGLSLDELNLGDVPYLYSLVPLAQSAKAPMYSLTYGDGLVGNQYGSARKYEEMLTDIVDNLLKNIGEKSC